MVIVVMCFTWGKILMTDYFATQKHYAALSACLLNALLYLFRFRYAVLITGLTLLLTTFNQLALFPAIERTSFFVKIGGNELSTPAVNIKSLALLITYLIILFSFRQTLMRGDAPKG